MKQIARAGTAHSGNLLGHAPLIGQAVRPAPARQIGQRRKRNLGIAKPVQQLPIGNRPDIGRTQQADAGKGFLLRKHCHDLLPTLGSVPARSRAMLARC